jgi:hypothetical protein
MLQEFIASIKGAGLARNNRYIVNMRIPAKTHIATSSLRTTMLYCEQVQLPGVNYSTTQNRTFGEFRETPYEKLYDICNMSFYVDTDMYIKFLFDRWMQTIQDPDNRCFNYYNEYTTDMEIQVQNLEDKVKYKVKLFECYPKSVSSVQMDYSNKDVMKLSVAMQYKYFTTSLTEELLSEEIVTVEEIGSYTSNYSSNQSSLAMTEEDNIEALNDTVVDLGMSDRNLDGF